MTPSLMDAIESVGWVLVHFVWQGAAIAALLYVGLSMARRSRPEIRYGMASFALVLMLAAPVVTALRVLKAGGAPAWDEGVAVTSLPASEEKRVPLAPAVRHEYSLASTSSQPSGIEGFTTTVRASLESALPWLVIVWAAGVCLLSVRLAGGWWRTRGLRTRSVSAAPPEWHDIVSRLSLRLGVRRAVSLAVSRALTIPVVIGHVKPVVLVPASALSGLSPSQLEAILAHEIAHVRRHDYLVNLAQTVIETVLFYHPAVWWVSRQIRLEREHCCDDLAVAACGDSRTYVEALLGLEQLRQPVLLLAPGAADGPLVARARRLLTVRDCDSGSPRLAASVIALTVAVVSVAGVSIRSAEPGTTLNEGMWPPPPALASEPEPEPGQRRTVPTSSQPPVPVAAVPKPDDTLAQRWSWADAEARTRRESRYWVGYAIHPVSSLKPLFYLDREAVIVGDSMSLRGNFVGGGKGWSFPGRQLELPIESSSVLKLLFAFDAAGGTPRLVGVHGSTIGLPMELRGMPVFWLGAAATAPSLERVTSLYSNASTVELKKELVAAAAVHDDSPAVVAWLEHRVGSKDSDEIRAEAAEWLAWHPIEPSLTALERIARKDGASRVRQEAAEALGDLAMPRATDVLVDLAGTLTDAEARREAVEALGERQELQARDALGRIAREDPSLDIQQEAVETLGAFHDQRGVPLLIELARTHPNSQVRREAIETLGEAMPGQEALPLLKQFALEDKDQEVQQEAVETLADLDQASSLQALIDIARTHTNKDVRREAVESLGEHVPDHGKGGGQLSEDDARQLTAVIDTLSALASEDRDRNIQVEAVETLGEIHDRRAIDRVRELAKSHASADVRREAIETLTEHAEPAEALKTLRETVERDADSGVRADAVERLAHVETAEARATLADLARTHKDEEVRAEAVESLGECPPAAETAEILKGIAQHDASRRVRDEAIETLAELHDGAGIQALIELARSHPDEQARRQALEALLESDHPRARAIFDKALQRP
jgi:HEAT repeat protein/beta-lactamase regulating signal transducer with metallopeptidase domain